MFSRMRFKVGLVILIGFVVGGSTAQGPKIEKQDGHRSPLAAKITFRDMTTRTVKVLGIGQPSPDLTSYYKFIFKGTGAGNSAVTLWLDSIRAIRDTTEQDALFVQKSGMERRLAWINELGMGGPPFRLRAVVVYNPDGPPEKIDLAAVNSVEFVE